MADVEGAREAREKEALARLGNVELEVAVELGRKQMTLTELVYIEELKAAGKEAVIDFDKLAGEAFDILVNGRRYAEGEIVVVTDLMAIRITNMAECEATP